MERLTPCIIKLMRHDKPDLYFLGFGSTGRPAFDLNEYRAKVIYTQRDLTGYLKFIPIMMKSLKMYPDSTLGTIHKPTLINPIL